MILPEDRAKPCALPLKEIEARLNVKQRKALRQIWLRIKSSKLPVRAYLDTLEAFEQMLLDAAREMFEEAGPDFEMKPSESLAVRVAQRYGAIAWLGAKSQRDGLEGSK